MSKKKIILGIAISLIVLVISLFFSLRTDNFSIKAFSILGVLVSAYAVFIFVLLSIRRVDTFSAKQRLILKRNTMNGFIVFISLYMISQIVHIIYSGEGGVLDSILEELFGLICMIGLSVMWIILTIRTKRTIKEQLRGLSE